MYAVTIKNQILKTGMTVWKTCKKLKLYRLKGQMSQQLKITKLLQNL